MEAIHTDAGTTGTAQSLFGKAAGQAGKGGGMFAALLALVGRQFGEAKELDQTGDGASNAAAGLQGLLALFNPQMANSAGSNDQTLIGDSGSDPLSAVASANGLDLSKLSDRSKLALLAQALADMKNGDTPTPPAGDGKAEGGIPLDPTATDQTMSPADLDAILAELRARAAAKFGADNGKPALTTDRMDAALAPKTDAAPAASPTGAGQTPFINDPTLGLNPESTTGTPSTSSAAAPVTPPAHPAVAGGSFVSLESEGDGEKPAESSASPQEEDASASTADGELSAPALPADGEAPPSKTPDAANSSPFQKVEVAPPAAAKPDARAPIHAAAAPDADKKADVKPDAAATAPANNDKTDKVARDDSSATASSSDAADSAGNSNSTTNTAAIDPRSHAAARATIQVPVEKLSQFLTQNDQLPLQIQRAVANGRDHITIQIVPHDLGRIEIKLDFDRSGTINTVIAADRPQTLDLLRRDAGGLERALQDAGFKTDGSSLSFNLQGEQRQQYQNQQNNPGPAAWQSSAGEEVERSYRPTYRIASTADAIRAAADGRVNIAV